LASVYRPHEADEFGRATRSIEIERGASHGKSLLGMKATMTGAGGTESKHVRTLRTQLWTMSRDVDALQLLAFPSEPLVPKYISVRIGRWAEGKFHYTTSRNIDSCIANLARQKANEIRVTHKFVFNQHSIKGVRIALARVTSSLSISPTSVLWAPTGGYKAEGRADFGRQLSFQSYERSLKVSGIKACLTLLESWIEFHAEADRETLAAALVEALGLSLGQRIPGQILGCAEFIDDGFWPNIFMRLAPWPKTYPMLAERFDDLHSFMIGPAPLCEELGQALETMGQGTLCHTAPGGRAVVYVPSSVIDTPNDPKP
jgi:hypothetical protein